MKIKNFVLKIPAIVILYVSWYLSSKSVIEGMPYFFGSDKIIHGICFAGLAGACTFWFSTESWNKKFLRNFIICVLFTALYGCIDEFHQSFVPGRQVSFFDWLADFLGALTGSFSGGFIMNYCFKRTQKKKDTIQNKN